MFIVSATAA